MLIDLILSLAVFTINPYNPVALMAILITMLITRYTRPVLLLCTTCLVFVRSRDIAICNAQLVIIYWLCDALYEQLPYFTH